MLGRRSAGVVLVLVGDRFGGGGDLLGFGRANLNQRRP